MYSNDSFLTQVTENLLCRIPYLQARKKWSGVTSGSDLEMVEFRILRGKIEAYSWNSGELTSVCLGTYLKEYHGLQSWREEGSRRSG